MTQTRLIEAELALVDSIKRGDTEAVGWLLAAGTNPDAVDFLEGHPALRIATARGHLSIVRLLLEHGARPSETPGNPPPTPAPVVEAKKPAAPPARGKPANRPAEPPWLGELASLYWQVGYIRRPLGGEDDSVGRDEDWQVRFLPRGKGELNKLTRVLEKAGFSFGPPQRRFGNQRVTITGREAVKRLTALLAGRDGQSRHRGEQRG